MVPADQLLLGLREVERQPARLGVGAHQEQQQRQRLEQDEPTPPRLPVDHPLQVQAAGHQEHAEHRHPQRDLVADDLGTRPQRAEQRVLVVGAPAGQDHAVDREAAEREDVQDADVESRGEGEGEVAAVGVLGLVERGDARLRVRGRYGGPERDDGDGQERGGQRHHRREQVERPVHVVGEDLLLEEELAAVGHRLEQPGGADPVGAEPVLHPRRHLPLGERQVGEQAQEEAHHADDDDRGVGRVERGHLGVS